MDRVDDAMRRFAFVNGHFVIVRILVVVVLITRDEPITIMNARRLVFWRRAYRIMVMTIARLPSPSFDASADE